MKALILTGGKSSRMGQDKASLQIGGVTQLERIHALVQPLTDQIFLSVAHGDTAERSLPTLPDLEPSPGPLGGLQAAFDADAGTSWLVIACDLPMIEAPDLRALSSSGLSLAGS